jgi:5-methyltetrahydrofolate--homocysteine methyltransferase
LIAPFSGARTLHWTLEEILPCLDKRVLIASRWRMKEGAKAEQFFTENLSLLQDKKIIGFSAVYGYFACRRRGKNSLLLSAGGQDLVFDFPRRNKISLADYFREKGDLAPFFIVSCGAAISLLEKELFAADQYRRYLLLHGFGVQLAESMAAKMHQHIRQELGLDEKQGKRFSPGYPAWPELADQQKLVLLLNAGKIGVSLSEKFQLIPELSVSAMIVCHPQAVYF